ncbi:MAG: hypothetical protein ACOYM2_16150 [Rectinemataceae bacterium]
MTEHDLASRMQGFAHHLLERLHARSFRWSTDPLLAAKQMAALEGIEIKEWTSMIHEWAEGERNRAFFKGHQNARRWNFEDASAVIRQDNAREPEVGDLVISASSQTVQWNGSPDPWYWTEGDAEAMKDERIVVLMRRTEMERRIAEARRGE